VHPVLVDGRSPPGNNSGMHARDEVEFFQPVFVGETLTLRWQVAEVYEKRGRPWWVRECIITGPDGQLRLRRRIHTAFQRDASIESAE
jgi:acyl dehydratase